MRFFASLSSAVLSCGQQKKYCLTKVDLVLDCEDLQLESHSLPEVAAAASDYNFYLRQVLSAMHYGQDRPSLFLCCLCSLCMALTVPSDSKKK